MTEKDYNECVTTYADNVYRFILKNLRHEEDSRDVVQTTFEKMWIHREEIDAAKCKSYLFTVAYRQMIDHIRKVKRIQLKDDFNEGFKVENKPANNLKKVLDEAAIRIVKLAGQNGFASFPPDISRDTDVLHITRTWAFTRSDELTSQ